jgi:hypothetical protein
MIDTPLLRKMDMTVWEALKAPTGSASYAFPKIVPAFSLCRKKWGTFIRTASRI